MSLNRKRSLTIFKSNTKSFSLLTILPDRKTSSLHFGESHSESENVSEAIFTIRNVLKFLRYGETNSFAPPTTITIIYDVFRGTSVASFRNHVQQDVTQPEAIFDHLQVKYITDTQQLVPRSNVRPAPDPLYPNLRVRPQTEDLRTNRTDPRVYTPGGIDATPMSTVEHDDEFVSPTETSGERNTNTPSQGPITN
eukprot:scaffold14162_cov106-Amphora_coffeaeformis.AAC.1